MIRSCKDIDIEQWETVYPWVYECVNRHKRRNDFRRLLIFFGGMSKQEYYTALKENNCNPFLDACINIAKEAARRIRARNLSLPPVKIRQMTDKSSGKERPIGRESAMQQVFDYIAKRSISEITRRRIVPQQVSSIKERGQCLGVNIVQNWVKEDCDAERWAKRHNISYSRKRRYYAKLDIKKCFPSMRVKTFMRFFKRDCGNNAILWLWETLLTSHRVQGYKGFMIGALPSETAAQYLMSFIYRYAMSLHKERRGKSVKLISDSLFFMDDQIYFSASRRDLKVAIRKIIKFASEELGLTIKPTWQICDIAETPLDTMGFVIHADATVTVRPRVFIRARRMALRYLRRGKMVIEQARRICSYKGYFHPNKKKMRKRGIKLNLKTRKVDRKLCLIKLFDTAAAVVSRYERRKKNDNTLFRKADSYVIYAPA